MNTIRIFSSNTFSSPNFKGVNMVQISKKAFQNPGDILECEKIFKKTINELVGQKKTDIIGNIASMLGIKKPNKKVITYLESPYFTAVKLLVSKFNKTGYSDEWLAANRSIPLGKAKCPDFHSFFVLTGANKDKAFEVMTSKKKQPGSAAAKIDAALISDAEFSQRKNDFLWVAARTARATSDVMIEKATQNTPVKEFQIDSLDKLKDIITEFDK